MDAGPNAWILIRDEDVQNFIQKILQEFRISFENFKVSNRIDHENFLNLQQKAFVDIEAIIETSDSGPQVINYE